MDTSRRAHNTHVESCGQTLQEHFDAGILGLNVAGVGILCPEAYQAICEVAEAYRIVGQFPKHEPKADGPGVKLGTACLEELQREEAEATKSNVVEGEVVRRAEPTPIDPHSAYENLSSEQKKRFN